MAPRKQSGDTTPAGYTFDESQNAFVVDDNWSRDDATTTARLNRAGIMVDQDVVNGLTDDQVQAADLYALSTEAKLGNIPALPDQLVGLTAPPADPTPADPQPAVDPTPAGAATSPTGRPPTSEERDVMQAMMGSRHGLYNFPGTGYGVDGPEYETDLVESLVPLGWAEVDPTGGNDGSLKITAAGREAYAI